MSRPRWVFRTFDESLVSSIESAAGVPPVVARIFASRQITNPSQIQSFLDCSLGNLRHPGELHDMAAAVELIVEAVRSQDRICIFGDYDCDGMTGTAILYRCLELMNANVKYHIPNRLSDGYGLNNSAIDRLHRDGVAVIVTVDCGIGSRSQIEYANSLGMRVIVTDHHTMPAALPAAAAIVHPQHPQGTYPFAGLCGAAVAFKLAWNLCQEYSQCEKVPSRFKSFLMSALGLAAIGTVADVVPLLDENRIIVKHGLQTLRHAPYPGLRELMRLTGLQGQPQLSAGHLAFKIGPRLNAAGRLGQAPLAVELLTTDNEKRASDLAEYLHQLNDSRDSLERSVLKAARQQIKDQNLESDAALVLAGRGWHAGVIGIVAGRIAEKFSRPTLVISLDETKIRPGMGSGRSVPGVNLYRAIEQCRDLLVSFGGHAAAVGLRIREEQVEHFREELCRVISEQYAPHELEPVLHIDAEVPLAQLTVETLKQLQLLEPFGQDNQAPLLVASEVEFDGEPKRMGKGELHFSGRIKQHGIALRCVAFGKGDWVEELHQKPGPYDFAFKPQLNEFNGRRSVEVELIDWRQSHAAPVIDA